MPVRALTATTIAKLPAPKTGSTDFFDSGCDAALCLARLPPHPNVVRVQPPQRTPTSRPPRPLPRRRPSRSPPEAATELAAAFRRRSRSGRREPKEHGRSDRPNVAHAHPIEEPQHASVARLIEREVIAKIGHKPIAQVRKPDIYRAHRVGRRPRRRGAGEALGHLSRRNVQVGAHPRADPGEPGRAP